MATFDLKIGSSLQHFEINDSHLLAVLKPKTIPLPMSPQSILLRALDHAIASDTFDAIFNRANSVVIIVPDKTRNCGAHHVLPILLERLQAVGVTDSKIKIMFATGTHVGHTADQIRKIIGKEIATRCQCFDHNCHELQSLACLGETQFGTPVWINKNLVEADKILVMSAAVHHYFAGYGGGPKMINPGCAGYETISKNHALTIDPQTGWLHPNCRAGEVETNPVQMDIADSLRFISADFLFETVLNDAGDIVAAAAGDLMFAHRRACQLVDDYYKVPISEKADLVVVSCGGYPKDINFIQSHKSLHNAFYAVKEGGVILALAECREGIGSQTVMEWFDCPDDSSFQENLMRHYKVNGTTALALKMKTRAATIILVSSLPAEVVQKLGMVPAATVAEAWKLAQDRLPQNFRSYLIPNGSLTLPQLN